MARPPSSSPVLCLLDGDPSAGWREWEEHRAVGKTGLCAPFGEASGTGGVLPLPSLVSGELREGRDLVAVALVSPRREQLEGLLTQSPRDPQSVLPREQGTGASWHGGKYSRIFLLTVETGGGGGALATEGEGPERQGGMGGEGAAKGG